MARSSTYALAWLALASGCGGSKSSPPAQLGAAAPEAGVQSPLAPSAAASGAAAAMDAGAIKATPDAGLAHKRWPTCDAGVAEDADAGDSPYTDACLVDEQHGVFVDATRGDDDTADGSRDLPFKSLAAAIRLAVNQHKSVYACAGVYEEPMRLGTDLTNGLELYGSFSCTTFLADPNAGRSLVRAKGKGAALQISNTQSLTVTGFDFENVAGDGAAGTTYVGALIESAQKIVLRDVKLRAASGEVGSDGAAPAPPATGAMPGADGSDACTSATSPGGAGGLSPGCPMPQNVNAPGGAGGGGGIGTANGGTGYWFGSPQGGQGDTGSGWSCTVGSGLGSMQSAGYQGSFGAGASGFGAIISGGFVGFSGTAGGSGSSGYGGAGGGGARAPASCAGLSVPSGASGGGGGAGGCGGAGGKAGGPGGSSFGLIAIDSSVRFDGGSIAIGDGGRGGGGALGQLGAKGAPGGNGGKGVSGSNAACDGIAGSDGGPGGPGGGGNGGHAIGMLYTGRAPKLIGIAGESDLAMRHGGAAGLAPSAVDPSQTMALTGSAGIVAFVYSL